MKRERGRRIPDQVRDDDEAGSAECPPWVAAFLAGLIVTGSVREAVAEAGIDFDTAWALREAEPAFEYYWDKALRVHRGVTAVFDAMEWAEEPGIGTLH